jgi:peptidoglycan/xylan/chitin deacetylase (PgdA/CDA1 family)
MLLILMYHRVHGRGRVPRALARHLSYLADRHPLVWPGDPLPKGELSVCLTFDDATFDFYYEVHPLLERLGAKALVAVPTRWIEADSDLDPATRLAAQDRAAMSGDYGTAGSPLCTWRELRELQAGGRVQYVSHSHSHADLTQAGLDLQQELDLSRQLLTGGVGAVPETLVFPYGRTNPAVTRQVCAGFRYAMRIGSALNRDWRGNGGLLYRVDAEHFWPQGKLWSRRQSLGWGLKSLANRLRGV